MKLRDRAVPSAFVVLLAAMTSCGSADLPRATSSVPALPSTDSRFAPGDSVQETGKFCALIKEWAEVQEDFENEESPAGRVLSSTRILELFKEVPANAPASIEEPMRVIVTTDPDSIVISESRKRDEAVAKVDALVERACDLRFSFDGYDFRENG